MPERAPADEIRRRINLLAIVTMVLLLAVGAAGGLLIRNTAQNDADRLYADSVASCLRVDNVRTELNQLYSAFETHNTLTFRLFDAVGAGLVGNNPRVGRIFTAYAKQYAHIQHEYDNIESVDCRRVIGKP